MCNKLQICNGNAKKQSKLTRIQQKATPTEAWKILQNQFDAALEISRFICDLEGKRRGKINDKQE
jgi:hypothetical protein